MALDRDDILRRMVTGAEYIERTDLTEAQRQKALARYTELEDELARLKQMEKEHVPATDDQIQAAKDRIRDILKPEKARKQA